MFAEIDFEWDLEGVSGRFMVEGVLEANIEPIRNYWAKGELEQNHSNRFAAVTYASYGPYGIIPEESFPDRSS
jgi:hypothetical protein